MFKSKSSILYRVSFFASLIFMAIALMVYALGHGIWAGPFVIIAFLSLGVSVRGTKHFKGLSFTLCVLAAVAATMFYPQIFIRWGDFELKKLIVPLIQLIMFGMGTTLCVADFARVFKMPRAFVIGLALQFVVMPMTGALIAKIFGLSPMIAVGLILVGSCPGGVASNVINYLAKNNVALSVTTTAVSTLVSPLMTPLMMKLLANQYTHVAFWAMMVEILKMIILPVVAGLILNKLLHKFSAIRDRVLPLFSMVCLCFIITVITALSRDRLLTMGMVIFGVCVLHNTIGYTLAYWGSRLFGLDVVSSRTIAVEVGLQNGGMASAMAINVWNSADAGLAPAIFGVWQNVSGSILASYWGRKSVKKKTSRSDIYYWKCDNEVPLSEKLVYNDKYRLADISDLVKTIGREYFKDDDITVLAANGEGNHYTYIIRVKDKDIFFRADDGKVDDDYMDAEVAAMELVRKHQVCVPQVYHCDTSMSQYPIRYQMMERVSGKSLNVLDQNRTLNRKSIGLQLGRMLARMHDIKLDGFGFFDTETLRRQGDVVGLDESNEDYFFKKLDDHLKFLQDNDFLHNGQVNEIERLIEKNAYLLKLEQGSVVHKDIAFWNIIGTEDKINAIIDWDDVIIGDPADDIAIMRCFYDDVLDYIYEGYQEHTKITDTFRAKTTLYLVRNMLWKAKIRIFMKYFDKNNGSFMRNQENEKCLKQFTYDRLSMGLEELKKL